MMTFNETNGMLSNGSSSIDKDPTILKSVLDTEQSTR